METNTEGKDRSPTENDDAVEGVPTEDVPQEGTRLFPRFDMCHPMFYRFEDYLMGIDGGERSEKTAKEIAVDVSKYLKYACGRGARWLIGEGLLTTTC